MKGVEIKCALMMRGIVLQNIAKICGVSLSCVSQTIYQNKGYCNRKVAKELSKIIGKPIKEIFPKYRDLKDKKIKRVVKVGNKRYPFCEVLNEQTKNANTESSQPIA